MLCIQRFGDGAQMGSIKLRMMPSHRPGRISGPVYALHPRDYQGIGHIADY